VLTINDGAVTASKIPDGSITAAKVADGAITAAKIANRTRKVFIPSNAIVFESNAAPVLMSGSGTSNTGVWARRLGNNTVEAATVTIQVPSDYAGSGVAGLGAPRLTIYWSTDSTLTNASRKVNVDVSWRNLADFINNPDPGNTLRYSFRSGVTAANGDSVTECNEPLAAKQVVATTIPSAAESDVWAGTGTTWSANDLIVLTLRRNGTASDDPNTANMYIVGIGFDYDADQ
jgi:hypothetical protein